MRSHVHRKRAQPELAARSAASRVLPPGRKGQETHPRQPLQVAGPSRRGPENPISEAESRSPPSTPPSRSSALQTARTRSQPPSAPQENSASNPCLTENRRDERSLATAMIAVPHPRSTVQTRHRPRTRIRDDHLDPRRGTRCRRSLGRRALRGHGLADQETTVRIERQLAKRHLAEGALVLCDLTSVYLEGSKCTLARHGYSRDRKRGKLQITFGLLCNRDGCPVASRSLPGQRRMDPGTLGAHVKKLKDRFSLDRVVMVGDRGLITNARIREDLEPSELFVDQRPAGAGNPHALADQGHLQTVDLRRDEHVQRRSALPSSTLRSG